MRTVFEVMVGDDDDEWCVVCKRRADYWVTMYARAGIQMFNLPCGHSWRDDTPPLTDKERAALAVWILKGET